MSIKPTVKFKEVVSIDEYRCGLDGGYTATLRGVKGHPRLGNPNGCVFTSHIVNINDDQTYIETLNTNYVKE